MSGSFLKSIEIIKVRHLENIKIPLSGDKLKHLILTGKNGSGKTSCLNAFKAYLNHFSHNNRGYMKHVSLWIQENDEKRETLLNQIKQNSERTGLKTELVKTENAIKNLEKQIENTGIIDLTFNDADEVYSKFMSGNFIFASFEVRRLASPRDPEGVKKIKFRDKYSVEEYINKDFIQHLLNLKTDILFAKDAGDFETAKKIDNWFNSFIENLKLIFEDEELELEFDRKNYNFYIKQKNREPFKLNQLSDGFSSVLFIVSEILLRMHERNSYDMEGVVLIDEIETHLHVSLQKKILPFLTAFFPNIQFIVTTHSPFILNSIPNAVVYDLEKQICFEDASAYSYEGLVEGFFDTDQYSDEIKSKLKEYEYLSEKKKHTEKEELYLSKLERYFEGVPAHIAEDVLIQYNSVRLKHVFKKQTKSK